MTVTTVLQQPKCTIFADMTSPLRPPMSLRSRSAFLSAMRPVLLACLSLLPLLSAANCSKTVRWYDDAPYSFKGRDGQPQGANVDLMRAALKAMRCEVKFVEMPWARALVQLKAGQLDLLPGALHTPEREQFAYFSRPINRSPNRLFVSSKADTRYRLNNLTDMGGTRFRLGAQIGVAYGPEFDRLAKTPEFMGSITLITSRRSAWRMMELDRIDGIIADEVSALIELKEEGLLGTVVKTNIVVSDLPALVAMSRVTTTPEFVANFDKAIGNLISDGSYKTIMDRYMPCSVSSETLGCN